MGREELEMVVKIPGCSLEARVKSNQEWVVACCLKDMLLGLHPVNVLVVCHQLLFNHLHCIDPLGRLQFDHKDLGIGATADDLDQVKISKGNHVGLLLAASASLIFPFNDDRVIGELWTRQHRLLRSDIFRIGRPSRHRCHAPGVAHHSAQLVALLMDEQPALDALEALPSKTPDAVMTIGTGSLPVESLRLQTGHCV